MPIKSMLLVPVFGLVVAFAPVEVAAQLLCWNCAESPWDDDGSICEGSFSGGSWNCAQEGTPGDHDCNATGTCAIMADGWAFSQAIAEVESGGTPSLSSPYELVADDKSTWLMLKCDRTIAARLGVRQEDAERVAQWVALPPAQPISPTTTVALLTHTAPETVSQE